MDESMDFPLIEEHLPELMAFVSGLAAEIDSGAVSSWEEMAAKVHDFFTPQMMDKIEQIAPGWKQMSSYYDGRTLVHVISVFLELHLCPEYRQADPRLQGLAKWTVLFHDLAKEIKGGHDFLHGFRSAALAAPALPPLGFQTKPAYIGQIEDWARLTHSAAVLKLRYRKRIQDNRKLPQIMGGLDEMFGRTSPAALIVKAILLHLSINIDPGYPHYSAISDQQAQTHLYPELWPLLKILLLTDGCGWALFMPELKQERRQMALDEFERLEPVLEY